MTDLKPCPFCGSKDVGFTEVYYRVECNDCASHGPGPYIDEDYAINEWNERKNDTII